MSTLSVLGLVQEFCTLMGLPVPTAIVGSTDQAVLQYRAILNAVLREAGSASWPEQKIRGTFTSVATSDQGAITTLLPGFSQFVDNTLWLDSQTIPIRGPITDPMYAALTALDIAGPPYNYWLSGGHIYLTPTPPAGLDVSAIYRTAWRYYNGTIPSENLSADTDTTLVPDDVVLMGLQALWKKQRGQNFQTDWNLFQGTIAREVAATAPRLALDNTQLANRPSIFIPPGSWMQS
jgi:hypothetical protein